MRKKSPMKYLIIHGHFYQPPREDPWTGLVDHQPSALPYHDWNERITRECYAANTASRVLGSEGRIEDIVDNYRYLSFNFGPTLLSWMKINTPNIYHKIISADRESRKRNLGHGNALAQVYNHTILPLATPRDQATQIFWGKEDFIHHYGREPEGMWLAETAINNSVIDELIRHNIRFVVLSPWQADALKNPDTGEWINLGENPAPSDRPFLIKRESGSLAVFFYHPDLASGISFNHYLHNADSLMDRIESILHEPDRSGMVNVATDGEIYGHHEPFGDMCLAALFNKMERKPELTITNYGHFLELYPPTEEVRLKGGEDGKGTSWSCFHGVSRWYKDCGCSTGGPENWNQEWRTPLREAFDFLNQHLWPAYDKEMKRLTNTPPDEIRNRFIDVLSGKSERDDFFQQMVPVPQSKNDEESTKLRFFRLLEGQKYGQFMYTSCGWFFSELSGIEPVQNMKYAARALELYEPFLEPEVGKLFQEKLKDAISNLPEQGNGHRIFLRYAIQDSRLHQKIAGMFLTLNGLEIPMEKYGHFINRGITLFADSSGDKGRINTRNGELALFNRELGTTHTVQFSMSDPFDSLFPDIHLMDGDKPFLFKMEHIPLKIREKIGERHHHLLKKSGLEWLMKLSRTGPDSSMTGQLLATLPRSILTETTSLYHLFSVSGILIDLPVTRNREEIIQMVRILDTELPILNQYGWGSHKDLINRTMQDLVYRLTERWIDKRDQDFFPLIMEIVKLCHANGLDPIKPQLQDTVFEILTERKNSGITDELLELAGHLNFNTTIFSRPK